MENFDKLLETNQYNLIIEKTKDAKDANSLFYRAIAYASLLRFNDALNVILKNREVLEKDNMRLLIQLHIDVLILLQEFDLAFEEYAYYKEKPYVSQEVEELLKTLPKYIREKEKETYSSTKKELSDVEISKTLKTGSLEEIIYALDILKQRNITPFINDVLNLLIQYPKQSIRTFALLLLVSNKYDQDVKFKSNEELITLNPSKLTPPFESDDFKRCINFFHSNEKNVTLIENACQLFSSILVMIYPNTIESIDLLSLVAIKELARKYLNQETMLIKSAKEYQLNYNALLEAFDKYESILSRF